MDLTGPFSILGRSCVIYKNEDDQGKGTSNIEESRKSGNSGLKIGCGVVGWIPK